MIGARSSSAWRDRGLVVALGGLAMTACFSKPDRVADDAFESRCFGEAAFTVCLPELPTQPLMIDPSVQTELDTNDGGCATGVIVEPTSGGPKLCVLAGTSVSIAGTLTARGALPLVVLSTRGTLELAEDGLIDVSSQLMMPGAGANAASCLAGVASTGAGGGSGGSFGSTGGGGGDGLGGSGGTAAAPTAPAAVRGGCPGGRSLAGMNGGRGGGAVYLVSRDSLVIAGQINASGDGGAGGTVSGGGGGGGSGGLIALFAGDAIDANGARVWANGGGGGGGGAMGANDGGVGGVSTSPTAMAVGGLAGGNGATAGGAGSLVAGDGSAALDATRGGGGGGGGAGVILNVSGQSITGAMLSPPPTSD